MTQDCHFAAALRRQMESLEGRLTSQLRRSQLKGDRFQELSLARMSARMVSLETALPSIERKIAELVGTCRALEEEVEAQARRTDQASGKLWETRRALQEELRSHLLGIEAQHPEAASAPPAAPCASDDIVALGARVQRLEAIVEDRLAAKDTCASLEARWQDVEATRLGSVSAMTTSPSTPVGEAPFARAHEPSVPAEGVEADEERMRPLRRAGTGSRWLVEQGEHASGQRATAEHRMSHEEERAESLLKRLQCLDALQMYALGDRGGWCVPAHRAFEASAGADPASIAETPTAKERLRQNERAVDALDAQLRGARRHTMDLAGTVCGQQEELGALRRRVAEQERSLRELRDEVRPLAFQAETTKASAGTVGAAPATSADRRLRLRCGLHGAPRLRR